MKAENKYLIAIAIVIVVMIVIYFSVNTKNKDKEESSFKLPRWLRIGICNACPDPTSRFCKNGCWKPNA